MLGKRPELVIIGIEPQDISPWSTELTELIQSRIVELTLATLHEIEKAGGSYEKRNGGGVQ
jgi:hydrogenase maturation protease